jgi:hypothetical protein
MAALGGVAAPAQMYLAVNRHSPETLRGWAIPAATDIALNPRRAASARLAGAKFAQGGAGGQRSGISLE